VCYIATEGLQKEDASKGEVDSMFKSYTISRMLSGGETMKTLFLVLSLCVVLCGTALADTVTFDTYSGWNLICAPQVPLTPDTASVFANFDLMFTTGLTRWDSPTQSMLPYDPFSENGGEFGRVLLGDGYWLYDTANTITYSAVPDGVPDANNNMTDMWISLPGTGSGNGGWNLIGHPFNHDTAISATSDEYGNPLGDNIFVTDGKELKTLAQANDDGWLDGAFQYWDGSTQSMLSTGYFFNDDDHLRAKHGYWVRTYKDNLAMIIPAD